MFENLLENPNYTPSMFIDWLIHEVLKCRTDSALARQIGTTHTEISRIRGRRTPIGPAMLVRASMVSDLPVSALMEKMGLDSKTWRG